MPTTHQAKMPLATGNVSQIHLSTEPSPDSPKSACGFIVTFEEFRAAVLRSGMIGQLDRLLSSLGHVSGPDLARRATEAQAIAYGAMADRLFRDSVIASYRKLSLSQEDRASVVVRGFAHVCDDPDDQAIQLGDYAHVRGEIPALEAVKQCFAASLAPSTVVRCVESGVHPLEVKPFVTIRTNKPGAYPNAVLS